MVSRKVLIVEKHKAQTVRDFVESHHIFDKRYKIKIDEDKALVPISTDSLEDELNELFTKEFGFRPVIENGHYTEDANFQAPKNRIEILKTRVESDVGFVPDLPETFEIYGDLILIPSQALNSQEGQNLKVLEIICDVFRVKRIARKNAVVNDKFRSPRTDLLLGEDPLVCITENKIKYNFDITKSMFCRGNITEKLRLAQFDCSNELIVDLFAGIGYFVLPYLVHAKAKHVHACEWNPNSVKALELNLKLAGVSDRCTVLLGDNRLVAPQNIADRVNLGLIPSSEISWETAVKALKPSGGFLHIHANIEIKPEQSKSGAFKEGGEQINESILNLLHENKPGKWISCVEHIECVKSYAPKIYHIVYDIKCSNQDILSDK